MPNRLAQSTSPYLLQHADNPVDWLPWGEDAFIRAKLSDRPIFLSVGYSSCHWCHVMAHESFEDEEIAQILNDYFVCIKVDREERPDIDEAYMTAVQMMTGHGGWPMSVFLTADKRPFFAGTYWPKDDREGRPGFRSVLRQLAVAWSQKRSMVEQSANQISEALRKSMSPTAPTATLPLGSAMTEHAVHALIADFDRENGGFGSAPKFPSHTAIEFLFRYATTADSNPELQEAALSAALLTMRAMVFGGIHDHVGGGFHRYSTDAHWLLPHFEKMLYDNALMLGNLAQAVGICSELEPSLADLFTRAAQKLIDWIMREMTSEQGYFYSAIDADSEGEEGKFYVWTVQEVVDILQHHAPVFLDSFLFESDGNFLDEATHQRTGNNILHLQEDLSSQFEQELEFLRVHRDTRVRPSTDNKGLVGWNGLMIGALSDAALWPLAQNALVSILAAEKQHGSLPHQICDGVPSGNAFLEDYAYLTYGVLKMAICLGFLEEQGELPNQAIPPETLVKVAGRLCQEMVKKFYDEENGGFFGTCDEHESLFGRTKPVLDQPTPSANAIAIRCLLQLEDEVRARQSLEAFAGWMERAPHATEALHMTALMLHGLQETEEEPIVIPIESEEAAPVITEDIPPARTVIPEVGVSISAREVVTDGSGVGLVTITLGIPEGLHLNTNTPPARWLTPTKIDVRGVDAKVDYPAGVNDRYEGTISIPIQAKLLGGAKDAEFEVTISYQACTESECLLPKEKVFTVVLIRG